MQHYNKTGQGKATVFVALLMCVTLLISDLPPVNAASAGRPLVQAGSPGAATTVLAITPQPLAADAALPGRIRMYLPLVTQSLPPPARPDQSTPESTSPLPPTPPGLNLAANVISRPARVAPVTRSSLSGALTQQITLVAGWNLIALPLMPDDPSITAVLAPIAGSYTVVYTYDTCDAADSWKMYTPAAPPFVSDLTNVSPQIGLWINMKAAATLLITGRPAEISQQMLCQGWNLAGYPSLASEALPTALAGLAGAYDMVYAYRATDVSDPWKRYDPAAPTLVNDLAELGPGQGYWIHTQSATRLDVHNTFTPPQVTLTSPAAGAVLGGSSVAVEGTVAAQFALASVTVNGTPAQMDGDQFTAQVTLESGASVIAAVATDVLDQQGGATIAVQVDGEGPQITIGKPLARQAIYTTTPDIEITYGDQLGEVDTATLRAVLVDAAGGQTDITGMLSVGPTGASGTLSTALAEDRAYTLTVSMADTLSNASQAAASFYVPPDPETITQPAQPAEPGWISGVIYDSTTCDEYQTTCRGVAGVEVTLQQVDTTALQQTRAARKQLIANELAAKKSAYSLPALQDNLAVTAEVTGTVITGPDGFFAFPVEATGRYWLRAEKGGYTYGQRDAEIVKERSAATNAIYVTPMDPAVTPCGPDGCSHTSADGQMQVEVPAGAIPDGDQIQVTATEFDHVEYLPSGELPEGTWETYAFNLGGDSDYAFQQPFTVRIKNSKGFDPGTEIPLGFWNQHLMQWEHEGFAVVDPSGQWVEMQLLHFSNHDCNFPVSAWSGYPNPTASNQTTNTNNSCSAGDAAACTVHFKSGTLSEEITLPAVQVLNTSMAPRLVYDSQRANPGAVIDVKLELNPEPGVVLENHIGFTLFIEGRQTDSFSFQSEPAAGEVGRFRYYWDGRNAQGRRLPPGAYEYQVKLSVPYRAQFCSASYFGGPPDCAGGATGRFTEATVDTWMQGTVNLDAQPDGSLGAGWVLDGLQHLFASEAGRILIADGQRADGFYYPTRDLRGAGSVTLEGLGLAAAQLPVSAPLTSQQPISESAGLVERLPITDTALALPLAPWEPDQPLTVTTIITGSAPLLLSLERPGQPFTAADSISGAIPPFEPPALRPPAWETVPPYAEVSADEGTQVCGEITADTTWTSTASPYLVTCDVQVGVGVTLTIQPGVTVQFQNTTDDLIVAGRLDASGTVTAPVRFQPLSGATPGSWGRVTFLAGSTGALSHTILEYGGSEDGMVFVASDGVQVLESMVRFSADSGIVIQGASPLISSTQVLSNTGVYGGGIYNDSGSPTIQNNTFQGNSASSVGGGIYNGSGNPLISSTQVLSNTGAYGGGIYNDSGSPTIQNNTFQGNVAYNVAYLPGGVSYGGGLYNGTGNPRIENNIFQANLASGGIGGGIHNNYGDPAIERNTFNANGANNGGGLGNSAGNPVIYANLFRENWTPWGGAGGGIATSGNPVIEGNTFYGNASGGGQGGAIIAVGMPIIRGNIFHSNNATQGGGIAAYGDLVSPDYNLMWNNSGGDYWAASAGSHDIVADPLLVNPQGGDFHLAPGSPGIDAGDPDNAMIVDFEGDPRPMGLAPDIGADEVRGLGVVNTASVEALAPGETISYTVRLANMEPVAVSQVQVTGTLPAEVAFVSYQGEDIACTHDGSLWGGVFNCTPSGDTLAPGTSRWITITVNATDSPSAPVTLTSVVTATAVAAGSAVTGRDQAAPELTWCAVRLNGAPMGIDLQAAINASTQLSDVVDVSGNCTVHDITLDKTLTLQGGWDYRFTQRVPEGNITTLDAHYGDRVLQINGPVSPTIDGFVIARGLALQGGGIYADQGSPVIQHNIFRSNRTLLKWNDGKGGAIYSTSGNPLIEHNTFSGNFSHTGGGGIYNESGSPLIQNNTFQGNSTSGSGGGIFNASGNPSIRDNTFQSNSASSGSGIYNESGNPAIQDNAFQDNSAGWKGGSIYNGSGSPLIRNNTFVGDSAYLYGGGICNDSGNPSIRDNTFRDNSASDGGGIYNNSGDPTIQNNTFQGNSRGGIYSGTGSPLIQNNTLRGNGGAGIYTYSGRPVIRSNISVNNTGAGITGSYWYGVPYVDYNDVWNNTGGNYGNGVLPGAHDISVDPLLVNAEGGDLHPAPGSPCIDTGDPDNYPETDIVGNPRPLREGVDIGAYELPGFGLTKSGWPATAAPGDTITYRLNATNLEASVLSNVALTATLPVEMRYVSQQANGLDCTHDGSAWGGVLTCAVSGGSLAVGESRPLTLTVNIADAIPAPLPLVNIVEATAIGSSGPAAARTHATTEAGWCRVRLNDGPVGGDIQAAIDASTAPEDVVKVSGHCRDQNLVVDETLILQGGWSFDFSARSPTLHTTILDAGGSGVVLSIVGAASPTIDGFSIVHGFSAGTTAGGVAIDSGNPVIQNNTFRNNWASGLGGGVSNGSGNPVIQDNTFENNSSVSNGGAIFNQSGSPVIRNNSFQGNHCVYGPGGGIYNLSGSPVIENNTFRANLASSGYGSQGGGIYSGAGNPVIQNNIFQENWALNGGGVYNGSGSPLIQNNTFWGNSASWGAGGGLYNDTGRPIVRNNVFANNTASDMGGGGGIYNNRGGVTYSDYNDVWGNSGGDYVGVTPGANDISLDPQFIDAEAGDFHLAPGSPCINTADPFNYPDTDFEGEPRPMSYAADIGADEAWSSWVPSRTATDHSTLDWDANTATYTRVYPDGTRVHFKPDGAHDYTLDRIGNKTAYTYNADGSVAAIAFAPAGASAPSHTWTLAYTAGKLSGITDPAGWVTAFQVNDWGQLVQATFPDDATRRFSYDARGLLTQQENEHGEITSYDYDPYGRISSTTSPLRTVVDADTGESKVIREVRRYTPSDTGYALINDSAMGTPFNPAPRVPTSAELVDRVKMGAGSREGHTNEWGAWLDETDAIGRTTTYARNPANDVTRETTPDGACVDYTYDQVGNVLSATQLAAAQCAAAGAASTAGALAASTWTYTYESRFNQVKTATDPQGNTTTFVYDYEEGAGKAGSLIRVVHPPITTASGGQVTPTQRFTYDTHGQLATKTDLQGKTTRYVYTQGTSDEAKDGSHPLFAAGASPVPGLLTQVIVDAGDSGHLNLTTVYRDFNKAGDPQTVVNPRGAVTSYTYNAAGRLVTEANDLGFVTKYTYEWRVYGRSASGSDARLVKQIDGYTADGTTGRNRVTTFTYGPHDQILAQRTTADDMAWEILSAYDTNRRLAARSDAQGRTFTYVYDDAGQVTAATDPLSQTTTFSYTPKGELAALTRADGQVTQAAYDARGNLTGLTPPGRPEHTFAYDARDLVATYAPPAAGSADKDTAYSYNALGLLTDVTQPGSRHVGLAYDEAARLSRVTLARGAINHSYDPLTGQLTATTAPDGIGLTYLYDGEVVARAAWTGPVAGRIDWTVDRHFRVTEQTVNGAAPVQFEYSTDHLVTRAGDLSLTYKHQSGLLEGTALGVASDRWDYNGYGEQVGYAAEADAASLFTTHTTYDALGRIQTLNETVGGVTRDIRYTYDRAGRLVQVDQDGTAIAAYTYDANGNRLTTVTAGGSTSATYDDQDRLVQYGGASYAYTANGDLQSKTAGGQVTTYSYDELGNLMAVGLPGGTSIQYLVDGANRRIGKKVDGVLVQGFLYQDGLHPVAELDDANNVVSRFVYASGANVPDTLVRGGVTYRIIADHLGSPRLVVNAATGQVVQRMDYDAFGRVLQDTHPGFQPFGFAGGLYDRDTGLVRFGARDYDAGTGRWTVRDPILFVGGDSNLYSYLLEDPVNFVDPYGLQACPNSSSNAQPRPSWLPTGGGGAFGASIEAGLGYGGAGQVSDNVGSINGTFGNAANYGEYLSPRPGHNGVLFASVGAGAGTWVTNAKSWNDMAGPFQTYSLNLPFVSLQYGTAGSTYVVSAMLTAGLGISGSSYITQTRVKSW